MKNPDGGAVGIREKGRCPRFRGHNVQVFCYLHSATKGNLPKMS